MHSIRLVLSNGSNCRAFSLTKSKGRVSEDRVTGSVGPRIRQEFESDTTAENPNDCINFENTGNEENGKTGHFSQGTLPRYLKKMSSFGEWLATLAGS